MFSAETKLLAGTGEASLELGERSLSPFAPIGSPRLGKNPYVTCPLEQFRVIPTPSAAILLLPGKSKLLSILLRPNTKQMPS
jgi:hypothetical protein